MGVEINEMVDGIITSRVFDNLTSGKFGFNFNTDKIDGMTVSLYQDTAQAVSVKFDADGTILCRRDDGWYEISDAGRIKTGEDINFSLDLAPDRNTNYFNVRVGNKIVATALYNDSFNYIDRMVVSVPKDANASIGALEVTDSEGSIQMPRRQEASPEIFLPMVIESARAMYLTGDAEPRESSLCYITGGENLVLDSKNTSIGVDLGSVHTVNAIRITGAADIIRPADNTQYTLYKSDDNREWIRVKGFTFNHFTENGVSVALFEVTGVKTRYLKVTSSASTDMFAIADVRAEVRIVRQWKMAGYAMYLPDDTNPVFGTMNRELYDKFVIIRNGDSVGINFGLNSRVEAVELVGSGLSALDASAFELYYSTNNAKYIRIENVILSRDIREGKEVYRLTFEDTVCGYLKLHAVADMSVQLSDLYGGLCAYSGVEVESGDTINYYTGSARGAEGDFHTLPDGTLVMIYTGFPGAHGDNEDTVLKSTESTDGGYTWGDSRITLQKREGKLNIMCASYHYMANGDLALLYIEKDTEEIAHVYLRRSKDFGKSWGEPICITQAPIGYSIVSSAVNGLHISTENGGRFIVAINYNYRDSDVWGSPRAVSYVAYSDDDGYTWKKSATYVVLPSSAIEPVVAELNNGNLIMTLRTRGEGKIYQTISTDKGVTWAQPVAVEGVVTPSSTNAVLTIPSTGDTLLAWNNAFGMGNGPRDPLTFAISSDSGLTYKNVRDIIGGPAGWPCIRFYGRAVMLQYTGGTSVKVTDIAELYHTRAGSATVNDLPRAATPNAIYSNGWLTGVTSDMMFSLDGGESWKFCGGTSVCLGSVSTSILIKDIGTAATAPSDIQVVNIK